MAPTEQDIHPLSPSTSEDLSDNQFYLPAREFFHASLPCGLTYDDVSLATNFSTILPYDTDLEIHLSDSLQLGIPIISADMDTVSESQLAISMALNGGLGLIHSNMSENQQVKEVARVKNHVHGLIQEPITVGPDQLVGDVLDHIASSRIEFRTFPVVDDHGILLGLIPGSVVKERYRYRSVHDAMTPRSEVFTINKMENIDNSIAVADRFFNDHMGIHKLLVVDDHDHLQGLFTISDIERIAEESRSRLRPARDDDFRLVCGAAVSATRTSTGTLDRNRIIAHVGNLVDEGIDAVAVSTAHGHTQGIGETVRNLREAYPDLTLIAGNVTSAEGVEFLARAGANAIKVGQGPGSICTTRTVAGVGIPQLTALYCGSSAARKYDVRILADGGINKSGDIVKALTLADAVICGGLFAGCSEAPGKIVEISGKLYKQYRGMGSPEAMKVGSSIRYGYDAGNAQQKTSAEGVEALKEVSGSLDETIGPLIGGLQAGMGYLGAATLAELKSRARYIRVTSAGQREAGPHDVIELKTTND